MKSKKIILAIETSCDDTSIALIQDKKILANVIHDQNEVHKKYGGIFPEIASREHEKLLPLVLLQVLKDTNSSLKDIDKIAYTDFPGLPGSLHVGRSFAKGLGFLLGVKTKPINHLYGHLFSAWEENNYSYPFLGLVLSGGHASAYIVKSPKRIKEVSRTLDDAPGEAFDKVSRILSLGFPGGPLIDKLYKPEDAIIDFNCKHNDNLNFSFSGIKTAVNNFVSNNKKINKKEVASSFQKWIIDDICLKIENLLSIYKPQMIVISGGVSANSLLRERFKEYKVKTIFPSKQLSTDNAGMIGLYSSLI